VRSEKQTVIIIAMLVGTWMSACSQVSGPKATGRMSLPASTGIYGVGRIGYALTDRSRPELLSATPNAPRKIMVFVWYPTDRKAMHGTKTAPYLPDFDRVLPKLSPVRISGMFRPSTFRGIDLLPQTEVVENARIAPGKQRFPLLLFSHGWGNSTFLYTAELEDIVSHGYIVVAVDHPYDTNYTVFPDRDVIFFAQDRFDTETKKPKGFINYARDRVEVMGDDNKFALTEILKYANTRSRQAPFYKRVDEREIGAFGHSIGGLAAA
jgi:predicted dienelactone hydrolase